MVEEYAAAQIHMPVSVQEAVTGNDAQTILDWLDSPDDEIKLIKLTSEGIGGINMLLVTVMRGFKELASLFAATRGTCRCFRFPWHDVDTGCSNDGSRFK